MNMKEKAKKTMFVEGPVSPLFIGDSIAKHAANHAIGAHQIFLGQIRSDALGEAMVTAIDFSAYRDMADEAYRQFREELFSRYRITCLHVYHSLGKVNAGEINLFVFVSASHRKDAITACAELVEWIKQEIPVWGKIQLDNGDLFWKENTKAL